VETWKRHFSNSYNYISQLGNLFKSLFWWSTKFLFFLWHLNNKKPHTISIITCAFLTPWHAQNYNVINIYVLSTFFFVHVKFNVHLKHHGQQFKNTWFNLQEGSHGKWSIHGGHCFIDINHIGNQDASSNPCNWTIVDIHD